MCPVLQVVVDEKSQASGNPEFEVVNLVTSGGRSKPQGVSNLKQESSADIGMMI
jgi:hypothetical protein